MEEEKESGGGSCNACLLFQDKNAWAVSIDKDVVGLPQSCKESHVIVDLKSSLYSKDHKH